MSRHAAVALLGLGSLLAMTTRALAEVPLNELNTEQIQNAVRAVPNAPNPSGIAYSFANGQPALDWAIPAAQLPSGDVEAARPALVGVLNEALVQRNLGPGNAPLLTPEDGDRLAEVLVVKVSEPAAVPAQPAPPRQPTDEPNQPPALVGPFEVTIISDASEIIGFEVADKETPAAEIKLSVRTLDPSALPQQALRLDGNTARRSLTIEAPPTFVGVARLNLTATDAEGLSTRHPLVVRIVEPPRAELKRVLPPPPPRIIARETSPVQRMSNPCARGPIAQATPMPSAVVPSAQARASGQMAGGVVSRLELIRGRSTNDGPSLFNAAYEYYWAGYYAQALEAAAAGAQLNDDPRAWDYVALSSIMLGDMATAKAAARYSEAKTLVEPLIRPAVGMALVRAQGPIRNQLNQLKSEVPDRFAAMNVLAARPDLGFPKPEENSEGS